MSFLNNLVHHLEQLTGEQATAKSGVLGGALGGAGHVAPQMQHQQYAQYMNQDGTGGGFGPNNPSQLQVQPQHSPANLGIPTGNQVQMGQLRQMPQPGDFNPGYTPMQNSGFGSGGNPQFGAYNPNQNPGFSPQDNPYQQYWQ